MNFKQKLVYMALGCLFTLIGYTLATLNNNTTAQTDETIDEIVCRKLRVVDSQDKTVLVIERKAEKRTDDTDEEALSDDEALLKDLKALNDMLKKRRENFIYPDEGLPGGSVLTIYSPTSDRKLVEIGTKYGGAIRVSGERDHRAAALTSTSSGGNIYVTDKTGVLIGEMGGDAQGGFIQTRNKNGFRTGRLP
jgi:hypothetical protein